jgi:hypothetical protein
MVKYRNELQEAMKIVQGLFNKKCIKSFWVVNRRYNRRKWEDNVKMNRQEVGCGGMDWIELAQDRDRCPSLVNGVMNTRVP